MSQQAREFLWIVKESALGTLMTSPVAGTDSMYIRLVDGNSFSMYTKPVIEEIPYGGGFAVASEAISDHYECKGQLKTKLYPGQAQLLLDWASTRINSGQTSRPSSCQLASVLAPASRAKVGSQSSRLTVSVTRRGRSFPRQ